MNSQPTLGITEQAIARVSDLVAQKGSPDLYLRVFVKGGGVLGSNMDLSLNPIEILMIWSSRRAR